MDGTAAGYAVTGIAERVVAGGGVAEDAEVEVAEAVEVVAVGDRRSPQEKKALASEPGPFTCRPRQVTRSGRALYMEHGASALRGTSHRAPNCPQSS